MKTILAAATLIIATCSHAQGIREPDGIRSAGGGNDYQSKVNQYECADIKERIRWLDELSKQPQSPRRMEWIKNERRDMVDLDFKLMCK